MMILIVSYQKLNDEETAQKEAESEEKAEVVE